MIHNWTHERKQAFADCWNRSLNIASVAIELGLSRNYCSQVACWLRECGYQLKYMMNNPEATLSRAEVERLDAMVERLAMLYDTTPASITSHRRVRDGRIDARKALAYAAKNLLGLSFRQIGLYFRIWPNHTTPLYWERQCNEAHKEAAQAVFEQTALVEVEAA